MSGLSRRSFFAGAALSAAGVATVAGATATDSVADSVPPGPTAITPTDPQYPDIRLRGYNKRFVGAPDGVVIVGTTAHVVRAVNAAVRAGKQIGIRSGGHNLDGLVDDPAVKIVIDFSEMRSVTFDTERNAFLIEPGATLGEIYRTLYYGWGVTLPGGVCPAVGAGGHVVGGGVGAISRQYGLLADYLVAVETVVVDSTGAARAVVATNNPSDPAYELWWAQTGGGGGNFGVITKLWMRAPGARGTDPTQLLPKAPGGYMVGRAIFNWSDMTPDRFRQLTKNFGAWHEQNSSPTSEGRHVYGSLIAPRRVDDGKILISGQIDPTAAGSEQLLDGFLAAMSAGVGVTPLIVKTPNLPWLHATISIPDTAVSVGILGPPRSKTKGGFLKKRYTDDQMDVAYSYLTQTNSALRAAVFTMAGFGGQINAISSTATASAHRDSIMLGSVFSCWDVATDDAAQLAWNRGFFRDLYSATGGVPAPNDVNGGCYINWPDVDMIDPAWNTSGVAASTLYYKDNYPRLQRAKGKYDPLNVFRHTLSVRA